MRSRVRVLVILVSLWFLPPLLSGWAAEKKPSLLGKVGKGESPSSGQPLRVTSHQLEADNKNLVITFTGKVVARQADMTIHADEAKVFYEKKEEGNDVREIVATGNVKILQGERVATGQKAVFYNGEQKIVLTGQPRVWQGKDMVSGDKITVLIEEDKSLVGSGPDRRVEVILYPRGEGGAKKEKP
jgi:lipopolysaccharide export system protein LptA